MRLRTWNGLVVWTLLAGGSLGWPDVQAANRGRIIDSIPEEAALVLIVEDVSQARQDFQGTELGQMLQDPAVDRFREHGLRKLRDKMGEVQTAYGFKLEDVWTLFPGKAAAGCILSSAGSASSGAGGLHASFFMISDVGENAEQAASFLGGLSEFFRDQFKSNIAKRGERHWLVSSQDGEVFAYGIAGGRFIAALGQDVERVYARIAAAPGNSKIGASRFRSIYQPGEGACAFVDFEGLMALAAEQTRTADSKEKLRQTLQLLGIGNLRYAYSALKFDKALGAYQTKARLQFAGPPTGLAGLFGMTRIDRALVSRVPADATEVGVCSYDFAGTMSTIRKALGSEETKELDKGLADLETRSGINLESLLKALGPGVVFFSKSSAGGQLINAMQSIDMSLGLEVRNRAAVVEAVKRLEDLAGTYQRAQPNRTFEIEHTSVEDVEIRYLVLQGAPFSTMFSPAWAITDNSILVSLHPRTLIAELSTKERKITAEGEFERVWREATGQGANFLTWKNAGFNPSALGSVPMLAAIAVPNFVKARTTAQMNVCVEQMRLINEAKTLEGSRRATLDELVVSGRLKTKPVCPGGGEYKVGGLGAEPSCSLHGNLSSPKPASPTEKIGNSKVAMPDLPQWLQMIDWTFWPSSMQARPKRVDYVYGGKKEDSYEFRGEQHLSTPSLASVSTAGLLSAIAIPNFVKARGTAQKNACLINLRQLDAAKQQWALENRKAAGAEATMSDLAPYLPKLPVCPAGGVYSLGKLGEAPTCSIKGHEPGPREKKPAPR